ncbi:hypothetical protein ILUMI_13289 [Ignelater luminosus]|uniref:Transposase n=1 Tax=Ignelater luminosus TaxID=2038154 RepID=A0A8K0CSP0_IGNLU|nr:hypothetical protein ILUMI_13289 [Ignelater luminosus]
MTEDRLNGLCLMSVHRDIIMPDKDNFIERRQHPAKLKILESKKAEKRKCEDTPSTSSTIQKTSNTLTNWCSEKVLVTQTALNKALQNFVIQIVQPLQFVDNNSFIDLVMLGRDSALSLMCSKTSRKQIDFVATTADCWFKGKRSFLAVRAHWINPSTLERESAALACRRFKGKHAFDVLARQMYSIYLDYSMQNKIVCTTTDNGSNFCKAFRYYELEERENEDDNDEEFIELTSLLEGDDYSTEIIFPPHHRCACHTLHLIATKNAEKAMINARYKQIFRSNLAKCHKLWAKQNQSTQAADKIKDMLGAYLKTPVVTRWNSLYDAMLQINNHITHVPDSINTCMDFCALPRFTDAEREFIKEYCQVMCPLSTALDILQGEKGMYMGYLLPVLYSLKDKLDAQIMKSLIYCKPLVQVLLEGIEYRQVPVNMVEEGTGIGKVCSSTLQVGLVKGQ